MGLCPTGTMSRARSKSFLLGAGVGVRWTKRVQGEVAMPLTALAVRQVSFTDLGVELRRGQACGRKKLMNPHCCFYFLIQAQDLQ